MTIPDVYWKKKNYSAGKSYGEGKYGIKHTLSKTRNTAT
jgi:hypothetical protein